MLKIGKITISAIAILLTFSMFGCSSYPKTTNKKAKRVNYEDASSIDKYRIDYAYAVNKNWVAPKDTSSTNASNFASIVFKIMPDGSIKDIFVLDEPHSKEIAEAAINAIKRADRFKPHPKELKVPYVEMGLRFNTKGVR